MTSQTNTSFILYKYQEKKKCIEFVCMCQWIIEKQKFFVEM